MDKYIFYADSLSVIAPEQQSDNPYLTAEFRMFTTNKNRNYGRVTEAFIDEIIENAEKYVCLPLFADMEKIRCGDLNTLGHNYDPCTGTFDTEEIGSFCNFEKRMDEYGANLIGVARIPKRNSAACDAILTLWSQGRLCVSFEIMAPNVSYDPDGTYIIDRGEGNQLIGMTVVSIPAYEEAVALALVAEQVKQQQLNGVTDNDPQKQDGENGMTIEEAMARIAELEADAVKAAEAKQALEQTLEAEKTASAEKDTQLAEKDTQIAERDEKITTLEASVAELTPYKEREEAAQAEAARVAEEQKRNELKEYASAHGLNVEDEAVANAIAEMNYELITTEVIKAEANKKADEHADDKKDTQDDYQELAMFASMVISGDEELYKRV